MVLLRHLEVIILAAVIFLVEPASGNRWDWKGKTREGMTESTASSANYTFATSLNQTFSTSESTKNELVTKETVSRSLKYSPSTSSPASSFRSFKPNSRTISPTPSRAKPTSSRRIINEGETKETFDLKMDRDFTQDLLDNTSKGYKDLVKELVGVLTEVLNDLEGFEGLELEGFFPGSVIARSSAYFLSSSKSSIRSTLDQAQQNGALSSLGVTEIKYREELEDGREPRESGTSTLTYVLIAVGVVAGIGLCVFVVSKIRTKLAKKNQP